MQTTYNGKKISYTIFGGSHENEIGIEASGLPKGFEISQDKLNTLLKRRATGNNAWSSKRKENDIPIFESGISDNVLDGGKLRAIIKNNDIRSQDYDLNIPRPSHADYTAHIKYGSSINMSGGGPFSGRMTAPLCILGGICLQILETYGITIAAHIIQIGTICGDKFNSTNITKESLQNISTLDFPVENESTRNAMKAEIENAAAEGDSVGGIVECVAINVPVGIGGPLTDGLESSISSIIFGIPAVRGIEFGAGFEAAQMHGSKHNDPFCINDDGKIITKTNNHGGILGGIASGMPIIFRVAFKPTPSISKEQDSINLQTMQNTKLAISGRHDPCIVPRAVPVVEAACAIAILDAIYDAQSI
jgi:chorismate synthase